MSAHHRYSSAAQNAAHSWSARLLIFVCCLTLLWALFLPSYTYARETTVEIPAGQQVQGDVSTVGRDIVVWGEVRGDVTSWSGDIVIEGHVHGDVVSYGGKIELGSKARVEGHVLALAGGMQRVASASVAGQLIDDTATGRVVAAALVGLVDETQGAGGISYALVSVLLALTAFLLATILTLVWPRRAEGAGRMLLQIPWRSALLGLVTTALLAALLLPLAALLAVTLIGLPLVVMLLLLVQLPYVCGLTTLAQVVGRGLLNRTVLRHPGYATMAGSVVLLLPLVMLGALSFRWGVILFYLLAGIGLGALIISRGGAFAST